MIPLFNQFKGDKPMKIYEVEIIDGVGSDFIKCKAANVREALEIGNLYIRQWSLSNARIGEIRLVTTKRGCVNNGHG